MSLEFTDRYVGVRAADDGCGFNYDAATIPDDHYGLMTMRERAEELRATLRIASAVGKGTVIEVIVPAAEPLRQANPA